MTNYTWTISSLETAPKEGQLIDVVKIVHWRYKGVDDFTAYPDLTEADVIAWLEAGLDVDSLKANIDSQIADQKNPKIITLPLPWSENNEA
jgi:hypothetical protein